MEENLLKDMKFSIICKDGDVDVNIKGSIMALAALIATIALEDSSVKNIIKLAVVGLKANDKTANN